MKTIMSARAIIAGVMACVILAGCDAIEGIGKSGIERLEHCLQRVELPELKDANRQICIDELSHEYDPNKDSDYLPRRSTLSLRNNQDPVLNLSNSSRDSLVIGGTVTIYAPNVADGDCIAKLQGSRKCLPIRLSFDSPVWPGEESSITLMLSQLSRDNRDEATAAISHAVNADGNVYSWGFDRLRIIRLR
jgi:predicted small secreted protein